MGYCVFCDCCQYCVSCTHGSPDAQINITVTDDMLCNGGKVSLCNSSSFVDVSPAISAVVTPCHVKPFTTPPDVFCENKTSYRIGVSITNQTDHCIGVYIIFSFDGLVSALCKLQSRTPESSYNDYSGLSGVNVGHSFWVVTPHASINTTVCHRIFGCQNPCCIEPGVNIHDFKWQVTCVDKNLVGGQYCPNDHYAVNCDKPCCDCCCLKTDGSKTVSPNPGCCNTATVTFPVNCSPAFVCPGMVVCDGMPSIIPVNCDNGACGALSTFCNMYRQTPAPSCFCMYPGAGGCLPTGYPNVYASTPPIPIFPPPPASDLCSNTDTGHCAY